MKPLFRVAALLGGGLLGLSAQAQTTSAPNTSAQSTPLIAIKDAKLPFTVSLPKGWVGLNFKDGLGGVTIASQAQPPAALIRLLFIPKNGKRVNLQTEFRNFEGAVKEGGSSLSLKGEKPASYGGVSGVLRQYAISNKSGDLSMRVWFGNGAKNFYSFQLTVPSSAFERVNPLFERVLATVKF